MKKIAVDCDDVLYKCNEFSLQLLAEEYGVNFTIHDITAWRSFGNDLDLRLQYFSEPEFYRNLPLYEGAKEFIKSLNEASELIFLTAVPQQCQEARLIRLIEDFGVKEKQVFFSQNKSWFCGDVLLDDAPHHIKNSQAKKPIYRLQPWNEREAGIHVSDFAEAWREIWI